MSNYISKPTTESEFIGNVIFQLDNVRGFAGAGMRDEAQIKSRCLLEACEELVNFYAQKTLDQMKHKNEMSTEERQAFADEIAAEFGLKKAK